MHFDTCKVISGMARVEKDDKGDEGEKPANRFMGKEFDFEALGETLNFNVGGGTIEKQQSNINV